MNYSKIQKQNYLKNKDGDNETNMQVHEGTTGKPCEQIYCLINICRSFLELLLKSEHTCLNVFHAKPTPIYYAMHIQQQNREKEEKLLEFFYF